jgi:rhamnosyltransferase
MGSDAAPAVSLVIRCRDEEDWIGHCLSAVFAQDGPDAEVVIVDSGSTDQTLAIAATFPVARVVSLTEYLPGAALNRGVEATTGDLVVFLSAHCVPRDTSWLGHLVAGFAPEVAGVYGRQLPVAFSEATDFRDLIVTFGPEPRRQTRDCFFHNANSAIRRSVWDQTRFDETVPNIEDRLWAKQVLERGFSLAYEPQAAVFHYHGIHHNQSVQRAESTLEVLKMVESYDQVAYLPASLLPTERDIVAIIPMLESPGTVAGRDPLAELLTELTACAYLDDVFVVSTDRAVLETAARVGASGLARPEALASPEVGLGEVLKWAVEDLAGRKRFPDYIVYANPDYVLRPPRLIEALVEDACFKGLDSVVMAYPEYQDYWRFNADRGVYEQFGEALLPRPAKHPMYKSLPGLGTVSRARVVREGRLVSERSVGVVTTSDLRHTLRMTEESQRELIRLMLTASETPGGPRS